MIVPSVDETIPPTGRVIREATPLDALRAVYQLRLEGVVCHEVYPDNRRGGVEHPIVLHDPHARLMREANLHQQVATYALNVHVLWYAKQGDGVG